MRPLKYAEKPALPQPANIDSVRPSRSQRRYRFVTRIAVVSSAIRKFQSARPTLPVAHSLRLAKPRRISSRFFGASGVANPSLRVTQITGRPKVPTSSARNGAYFQHKNALFSPKNALFWSSRTHSINNGASFVASAAHFHRQNRPARAESRPLPSAADPLTR
jgi:hypothetical protein